MMMMKKKFNLQMRNNLLDLFKLRIILNAIRKPKKKRIKVKTFKPRWGGEDIKKR